MQDDLGLPDAPPVWIPTDEWLPRPGVDVMTYRSGEHFADRKGRKYIDRIVVIEMPVTMPDGRIRTRREKFWCRTPEGRHCHPVPADYYECWASTTHPED